MANVTGIPKQHLGLHQSGVVLLVTHLVVTHLVVTHLGSPLRRLAPKH
ncbi:MAG TPA: hypothetical protein VF328_02195 [Mycobacterium sp.]